MIEPVSASRANPPDLNPTAPASEYFTMGSRHLQPLGYPVRRALSAALLTLLACCNTACVSPARPLSDEQMAKRAAANPASAAISPRDDADSAARDSTDAAPHLPPLNGEYTAVFRAWFIGPIYARFTAESSPDGTSFIANTRTGIALSYLSGLEQALGAILSPVIFPNGTILHWSSSSPVNNTPGEGWIGVSTVGPLRARTFMLSPRGPVEIRQKDGKPFATFTIVPRDQEPPRPDYAALVDRLDAVAKERFFDPEVPQSPAMADFIADARASAKSAEDDLEFLFGTVMSWRKQKKLPLPLMYRPVDAASSSARISDIDAPVQPLEHRSDDSGKVATISANVFLDPAAVDDVMNHVLACRAAGLVIDMQNCPGLNLSALRMLAYLCDGDAPIDCGTFFDQNWRTRLATGQPREIVLDSPSSFADAERAVVSEGAIRAIVTPAPKRFRGKLVILTSRRTISTAETLAWCIRQSRGPAAPVIFIGEKTGQRPYLTRELDIGQGWVTRLATHDWRPPGMTLEDKWPGVGVDIECDRETALRRAARIAAEPAAESNARTPDQSP